MYRWRNFQLPSRYRKRPAAIVSCSNAKTGHRPTRRRPFISRRPSEFASAYGEGLLVRLIRPGPSAGTEYSLIGSQYRPAGVPGEKGVDAPPVKGTAAHLFPAGPDIYSEIFWLAPL